MAKSQAEVLIEEAANHLAGAFWGVAISYGMDIAEFESLVGMYRLAAEEAIRVARVRVLEREDARKGGA